MSEDDLSPNIDPAVLGLDRTVVRVVPYQPAWAALFAREAARLRAVLGERVLAIEHVGSTSVPGLAAKPILDLAASVPSLAGAVDL
ncbi:MAG TPA: GrpB family protein, partial [Longimicrobium sp.]